MRKYIVSIIFSFIFISISHASEGVYWSNYQSGPFTVEDAKKEFGNRPLYAIEGIWFDDGIGTVQIIRDWSEKSKFKMFIIDTGNSDINDFNGTWEATFFQADPKKARYSFFSRIWYGSKFSRSFKTQSGYSQINADTDFTELVMDYDSLSDYGVNMDGQMRRIWPANFSVYNDKKIKKIEKTLPKKDKIKSVKKTKKSKDFKEYWWVVVIMAVAAFFVYMHTTKNLPKLKKGRNNIGKNKNIIKKFFDGDIPLVTSFWGIYFGVGFILGLILFGITESGASDEAVGAYSIFVIIYSICAMIGTWKSATKYKLEKIKKKEGTGWGTAAQVYIGLSVLRIVVEIFTIFA